MYDQDAGGCSSDEQCWWRGEVMYQFGGGVDQMNSGCFGRDELQCSHFSSSSECNDGYNGEICYWDQNH